MAKFCQFSSLPARDRLFTKGPGMAYLSAFAAAVKNCKVGEKGCVLESPAVLDGMESILAEFFALSALCSSPSQDEETRAATARPRLVLNLFMN